MCLCVHDSRDNSRKVTPYPSLYYSLTHTPVHWFNQCDNQFGYHNQTHPLTESTTRLMILRGLYYSTSKWLTTSLTELMCRFSMYDDPPSVWGPLTKRKSHLLPFRHWRSRPSHSSWSYRWSQVTPSTWSRAWYRTRRAFPLTNSTSSFRASNSRTGVLRRLQHPGVHPGVHLV